MRIAILSQNDELPTVQKLMENSGSKGHTADVINPLGCYMDITSHKPNIRYKGVRLEQFDAIISPLGLPVSYYGTSILRQFELMGSLVENRSLAISRSQDKLRTLQLLARKGIELPDTGVAHSPDDTQDLITIVGTIPLTIKLLKDKGFYDNIFVETKKAAESVIDAFRSLNAHFLVQKYSEDNFNENIFCLVVGGKIISSVLRTANFSEDDLAPNFAYSHVKPYTKERELAIKSAKALGLNIVKIGMIHSSDHPVFIDVDASPDIEFFQKHTKTNLALAIIEYFERQYQNKTAKR